MENPNARSENCGRFLCLGRCTLSVQLFPFLSPGGDIFPRPGEVFPSGGGLGKEGKFRPHQSTAGRSQPISGKLFALAKASPFRERWHGEAVTERVAFGKNPFRHFALRNATSPEGGGLGKEGRSRPHQSTAGRSLPISGKLFAPAKASPFRERWHGEAVTERVASGANPLSLAALDSSPEGRALGKEGKFRPHSSTAGRSLPISGKLSASAKASPFRERWHGEAVTERVGSGKNPLSRLRRQLVPLFVACRRHLPPAGGSLSKGEPLARRAGLVLTSQRQEDVSR